MINAVSVWHADQRFWTAVKAADESQLIHISDDDRTMTTADELEAKRSAFVEILAWMAADLIAHSAGSERLGIFSGHAIGSEHSTRESVAGVLWRHGIVAPEEIEHDSWGYPRAASETFRLIVSRGRWRETAQSAFENDADFEEALGALINLAVEYHGLNTERRAAFPVGRRLAETFRRLEALGYVSRQGALYRWNELIAPHMIRHRYWTEQGQSIEAINKAELRRRVGDLPDDVRREVAFFAGEGQYLRAVKALRDATGWGLLDSMSGVDILHPGLRSSD